MSNFRSGFIAVVGRPNVGKSTLVNSIVGEKVSAVSNKPNTTRNRITGIRTMDDCQLVFMDTPGIHRARGKLGRSMVRTAYSTLAQCDLVMMVTDVEKPFGKADERIIGNLPGPAVVVVNKIDLIRKPELLKILQKSEEYGDVVSDIMPVSALKNDGVDTLTELLAKKLPEGEKIFPDEMYTDQPERFLVAEIVREKLFNLTKQEIPYKTAVTVDRFEEDPEKNIIRIYAVIFVERSNHKSIVIGKDGRMLKTAGVQAREDIEKMLGTKIYLDLWVKVKEKWSEKDSFLREFGYTELN